MAALGKSGKPVSLGLSTLLCFYRHPEAKALPIHLENLRMVGQAVQKRRGHALALEDLAPLAEGQVARHQDAAALVAGGENAEQNRCLGSGVLSSGDTIPNRLVAIRSIFSTCNALCQGGLLTLLDVPPSICYPSGRRWQRRGPKPGEQRNLDLRIGRESASRHDDCQHQGGRGPAVRGKVNPGEVLIKVVIRNKPKMLSGLNQKVRGQVRGLQTPLSWTLHHRPTSTT